MLHVSDVKRNIANVGVAKTLADVALRAANHVAVVKIVKAIDIDTVDRAFLDCDGKYHGSFLTEETLRKFSVDPKNELPSAFLDDALAKGDECYGFVAGDELAAYGWYSTKPTDYDLPGIRLHFGERDVYMYKGFTAHAHRGQRLHAVGMTRALEAYRRRGYTRLVSMVEWNNFASLKSCYRMGYRDFGNIAIAGAGGRYLLHHDSGCRARRFGLRKTDDRLAAASGDLMRGSSQL
jgi:hypothetical protein